MEKFVITSRNSPQLSKIARISESTLNFRGFHHFPDAKLRFFSKIAYISESTTNFRCVSPSQPYAAFSSIPLLSQRSTFAPVFLLPAFIAAGLLSLYLSNYLTIDDCGSWLETVFESTWRSTWRFYQSALGGVLGSSTRARMEVHLETEFGFAWRCAWRQHLSSLGDVFGDALGDAPGDSTRARSEVYLETEFGFSWRCAWRQYSSSLGGVLGN